MSRAKESLSEAVKARERESQQVLLERRLSGPKGFWDISTTTALDFRKI